MIGRRRREEDADISEFPSPSVKVTEHFHQCSVKVDGGYDKIETVTVCGKQREDEPFNIERQSGDRVRHIRKEALSR